MRVVVLIAVAMMVVACDSTGRSDQEMLQAPPRNMNPVILAQGKALYDENCKRCHLEGGKGSKDWRIQGPDGKYPPPPLDGTAHTWHHPKAVLVSVIKNGSPGGMGNMPPHRDKLSDNDIEAIITWFQSLWTEEAYRAWYGRDMANRHYSH